MNEHPKLKVSIIVPVFNGGQLFLRTVDSLRKITYPSELLQIILIDDGSKDNTVSWLKHVELPAHFKKIFHARNRGRAAARNSGLIASRGEILIFIDGDMLVEPDFVDQHLKALSPPGVEAVAGRMVPAPELKRTRLQRYLFEYPHRGAKQFGENRHVPFQYLITGNMSITRKAADAVGLFDEEFQGYGGEDVLYAFQLWMIFPGGIRYSKDAVATDQHPYKLEEMLVKYHHYGKYNLPRLIQEHPEMTKTLHTDYFTGNSMKRLAGWVILNKIVFKIAKFKYKFMPYPLSNWLIRLLLLTQLKMGFEENSKC